MASMSEAKAGLQTNSVIHCHDDNSQSTGHVHYDKCQCDNHATSSLPSIGKNQHFFLLEATVVLATIPPAFLSHNPDNIYRPPISA